MPAAGEETPPRRHDASAVREAAVVGQGRYRSSHVACTGLMISEGRGTGGKRGRGGSQGDTGPGQRQTSLSDFFGKKNAGGVADDDAENVNANAGKWLAPVAFAAPPPAT